MNYNHTLTSNPSICTTYRGGVSRHDEIVSLGVTVYCLLKYAYENGIVAFGEYLIKDTLVYILFLFFGYMMILLAFGTATLVDECRNKCKKYKYE